MPAKVNRPWASVVTAFGQAADALESGQTSSSGARDPGSSNREPSGLGDSL